MLRGLHDLNNHDKHRMVLPTTQYSVLGVSLDAMLLSALEERLRELPADAVKERENFARFKQQGFRTYSPMGAPTVALREGEPIAQMFYVNNPNDGLSFSDEKPGVVFPDGYFLTGAVCSTMSKLTDTIFQMVERFEGVARGMARTN